MWLFQGRDRGLAEWALELDVHPLFETLAVELVFAGGLHQGNVLVIFGVLDKRRLDVTILEISRLLQYVLHTYSAVVLVHYEYHNI